MDCKIFWADEALDNLESILSYLETEWTEREVANFKKKLSKQLDLIQRNPELFPISEYHSNLRKAVLSKQTIVFYQLKGFEIHITYLFNTRMDVKRLK